MVRLCGGPHNGLEVEWDVEGDVAEVWDDGSLEATGCEPWSGSYLRINAGEAVFVDQHPAGHPTGRDVR
jgi:hypothetical protein